jgi:hypothetical protein
MNAPIGVVPRISATVEAHTRKRLHFLMTKILFGWLTVDPSRRPPSSCQRNEQVGPEVPVRAWLAAGS